MAPRGVTQGSYLVLPDWRGSKALASISNLVKNKQAREIHACSFKPKDGFQPSEESMAWKAPKIIEVAVGLEINMYACASLKR